MNFVENHFPVAGEFTLERLARRDVSHFFLNSSCKSLRSLSYLNNLDPKILNMTMIGHHSTRPVFMDFDEK